ncbi:MAG: haloacid dehalogenase [Chloroflexi bacterium RBG_16_48_8]|nr:MAG: haloacid dehalogenase [Chloroflexi bacterium RBG_16_48_8]
MDNLEAIGERIHHYLEEKNKARDETLHKSRVLIRHCSRAIRAIHRNERGLAKEHLSDARKLADEMSSVQGSYPDIYFAGYTRDALKEFAEASIVYALIGNEPLPDPDELGVEYAAYLSGLGEAVGELRRRVLDILRHDAVTEGERLLDAMDDIYSYLVTVDFPDAITGNLRRITDMVRGVTERTRGDMTTSIQQRELKDALRDVERKLDQK